MKAKLKITFESQQDYTDFLKFALEKDESLTFNELYEHHAGAHKEPIIIGVITALGGASILKSVQGIIKEWLAFKKSKLSHELEIEKEKNRHLETKIQLALKVNAELDYKLLPLDTFEGAQSVESLVIKK